MVCCMVGCDTFGANLVRLLLQHLSGVRAIFCYQCIDFALCGAMCGFFHYHNQLLACFFTVVEKGCDRPPSEVLCRYR